MATAKTAAPGVWNIQLRVGEEGNLFGGDLQTTMKILHICLSTFEEPKSAVLIVVTIHFCCYNTKPDMYMT